ncbi:MAG: hypothetical protein JKY01_11520 [Pseudomonadales bacterium]|nr:hypothetical protein [Pseudomonadales bacterium]
MNVIHKKEKEKVIFDGNTVDMSSSIEEISFDSYNFRVMLKNLKPLGQLQQHYKNISPDDIYPAWGLKLRVLMASKYITEVSED